MKKFFSSLLSNQMILSLAITVVSSFVKNPQGKALYQDDLKTLRDVLNQVIGQ